MSTNFTYGNNINTTLASAITSSGQTTITLASSANLPTLTGGQILVLTLNDAATQSVFEVVYVTAITGATLTVTRGQEGTTATTWLVGDYAYAPVTAGILKNFALINGSSSQNFAAASLTATGVSSGTYTVTTGGTASGTTVYISNDGGAVNGMEFNVPTASTNGYTWRVNNTTALMELHVGGDLQIQPTINSTQAPANVPPVYNNGGANLGTTSHIVSGFVTASGASTTVNFSASAVFSNGNFAAFVYDQNGGAPVAVTNGAGTSFTFPSTSGHAYSYFAIGA